MKPETQSFITNLLIGLAVMVIIGGFLFVGQYKIAAVLICTGTGALLVSFALNYADERAQEAVHVQNMLVSLIQQQQTFYTQKIDYLLDRIQTGDPVLSHNLNVPSPPKPPQKQTMNFPVVDGVTVRDAQK